jgi:ABC-2 type transport system ATP-binding protein
LVVKNRGLRLIRLNAVTHRFGSIEVIRGATFTVHCGEVLGIVGDEGTGKSTLLRLIAALSAPTEGSIEHPPGFRERLGFVPEEPSVFDYLSSREVLYFMGRIYNLPRYLIERRAEELLRSFGIEVISIQAGKGYSRSVWQKIAIIGSLLHDPKYWLLDEPTQSLDLLAEHRLAEAIIERKLNDAAVVIATRKLALAQSVCDRLAFLDHGEVSFQELNHQDLEARREPISGFLSPRLAIRD